MRRLRTVAALLAVGPLLLAPLVGCSDPAAGTGAAADGTDPERVRLALQDVYDRTWGTPRTRHAVEVSAYVHHEERLAACMSERGAGHVPAPFVDATARDPGALSWYDPLVPVDPGAALLVPVQPVAAEVSPTRTWPGAGPTSEDLAACVQGPPAAPAVDPGLDEELYTLVTDVLGDDAEVDGYADCLAARGFEAATRDDLVTAVLDRRPADGGAAPDEPDAVVADAACREDAHRTAMAALEDPIADFVEQHADRLAGLDDEATRLQDQAREDAERMGLAVTWW